MLNSVTKWFHKVEPTKCTQNGKKMLILASSRKAQSSISVDYICGLAGTGQPFVRYPQLEFAPSNLFALGSPIGVFLSVRGVQQMGENFKLPTCPRFFNIFHPVGVAVSGGCVVVVLGGQWVLLSLCVRRVSSFGDTYVYVELMKYFNLVYFAKSSKLFLLVKALTIPSKQKFVRMFPFSDGPDNTSAGTHTFLSLAGSF